MFCKLIVFRNHYFKMNQSSFVCIPFNGFKYCYLIWIIQFYINQLNDFKYSEWSSHSMWPTNRALIGTTTPGQSGLRSNSNEGVLHIPQSSWNGTSPSDCLVSYPGTLVAVVLQQPHLTGFDDKWHENLFILNCKL